MGMGTGLGGLGGTEKRPRVRAAERGSGRGRRETLSPTASRGAPGSGTIPVPPRDVTQPKRSVRHRRRSLNHPSPAPALDPHPKLGVWASPLMSGCVRSLGQTRSPSGTRGSHTEPGGARGGRCHRCDILGAPKRGWNVRCGGGSFGREEKPGPSSGSSITRSPARFWDFGKAQLRVGLRDVGTFEVQENGGTVRCAT